MVNTPKESWSAVKSVFRQHHSLVVTLPMFIRKVLHIQQGDMLEFEWKPDGKEFVCRKFVPGGEKNGGDNRG